LVAQLIVKIRAGRLLWLFLATALAGCASVAAPSPELSPNASADACCNNVETAPSWFVRALDPAAPLVGSIVAHVTWRKGYLHGETEVMETLLDELRPLDIVLVTNKGRMSNISLPGYFVHAAVYLGDERELRRAGVWDDRAVEPYHSDVRAGKRFIEADSRGVHLSPPRVTLNVDRVVVVRPRGLSANGGAKRCPISLRRWVAVSISVSMRKRLNASFALNWSSVSFRKSICRCARHTGARCSSRTIWPMRRRTDIHRLPLSSISVATGMAGNRRRARICAAISPTIGPIETRTANPPSR
jgi:hypothetical protein